jgi:flagellar protein FliO/FliZ
MFDTLFGAEVSPALKFFIAFMIVLALIGVTAWLVRRFGSERFGGSSARGRQPRLAVVDAAAVDGRRRLVIIRRDNVEHLLMIGGPTDVVVEQNIVRAMGAPREKAGEVSVGRGLSISESLTRPVSAGEGSMWPLQPQPETNGRARAVPEEPVQWTWPTHSESQRPSSRPEPRVEKPDTRTATPLPMSRPAPTPPAPAAAAVEKAETLSAAAGPDQNLAEMANRLEASLRRGNEPRVAPEAKAESAPPAQRVTPPEAKPASTEAKPPDAKPKALFDSLEEEMASLLGRPPGKT